MKKTGRSSSKSESASRLIDARIRELDDWRGETLSKLRALIKQADPAVVEEWKWRGVPVWSHDGLICTGETYKTVVKLTFFLTAKAAELQVRLTAHSYECRDGVTSQDSAAPAAV